MRTRSFARDCETTMTTNRRTAAQGAQGVILSTILTLALISTAYGQKLAGSPGMVVSQSRAASDIGAAALAAGGNAIDAAVATAFALAVLHPSAGNIGGGGFIVYRPDKGDPQSVDFREQAPILSREDMFLDENGAYRKDRHHASHLSVGTPGTPAGLWLAHSRFGRLPWSELVAPAVALARDGFVVTEWLARDLEKQKERMARYPASLANFFKEGGVPYRAGEILKFPDLARTLARIRDAGADGFYRGETADLLVAEMKSGGGILSHDDLANYRAVMRPCVVGTYRGHTITSMGPPSSGGTTLIHMLEMLETQRLTRDPADRLHLFAEVMRRGFAARAARLGDPDFSPIELTRPLLDPEFARKSMDDFSWTKASSSKLENFSWQTEGEHTTHLSVVDPDGNAVALTYTLEDAYGSAIVCRGGGFLLNNEMGDFNPRPGLTTKDGLIGSRPNVVAPRKRMLSSMTPTIVSNASGVRWILGTPGGRTIINTVFQLTANLIDCEWPIDRAVAFPRIHHQWFPDVLRVEKRLEDEAVIASLRARGHTIEFVDSIGAAECIAIKRSNRAEAPVTLEAGVDPRAPDGGAAKIVRPKSR